MTVTYQKDVEPTSFGTFWSAIFRWKGSIYQMLIRHLLMYIFVYIIISLIYHLILPSFPDAKFSFEQFCLSCKNHTRFIPLTFLLGFYVSQVFSRWWMQFTSLCGPDTIAMKLALYCPGEKARELKRTFMRYINAAFVITLRAVSKRASHRFPDLASMVKEGYLTEYEKDQIEKLDKSFGGRHNLHWYPTLMANIVMRKMYDEGFFPGEGSFRDLSSQVANFNSANGKITVIAWVNMPLAYTQMVTIAVEAYFVLILFARQVLVPSSENYEILGLKPNQQTEWYTVIIVLFEFFFYQGWLKVAESMFNPWGEDDDDFEVGYLMDRHLDVSMFTVDFDYIKSQPDPLAEIYPMLPYEEKIAIIENNGDPFPSPRMKALGLKNGNQALYYDAKKESIEMEEIGADEKA